MGSGEIYSRFQIPVPPEIAHRISLRAAEIVRKTAPRGPNNSRRFIRATWQKGQIGIHVPPQAEHLIYLNYGWAPFIPKGLEGKTVPMRMPNGSIIFRRAKGVGRPRILTRDNTGKIITSKIAWKNPGFTGLGFIEAGLRQAVLEWRDTLNPPDLIAMMRKVNGPVGDFFRRLTRG